MNGRPVTVCIFLYVLGGNLFAAAWHAREFWLHAVDKRLKLAQFVLFTGPLGWIAFIGREWALISFPVASVLVVFAVAGTTLHVLSILSQVSQARPR